MHLYIGQFSLQRLDQGLDVRKTPTLTSRRRLQRAAQDHCVRGRTVLGLTPNDICPIDD